MEENEVFDSSLLKECVHSLIANGKRNFAIDLTGLDYLYSDTINVLMALNKRALEVSGRLSLLSPQVEVLQILKRAGIHNILRIFDTEEDLLKTSEEIILQTTSYKIGDIKNAPDNIPQSEFDQLRNEIGAVFDSSDEGDSDQQQFVQSSPQQSYVTDPSIDQEFDEAFQHFESDDDFQDDQGDQFNQNQFPNQYAPPPTPQYKKTSHIGQFGNRQFMPQPPPPVPPKMPLQQPQPGSDTGYKQQVPRGNMPPPPPDIMMRQETQRFPSAPAAPQKPSVKPPERPSKDSFDETFEMPSSKLKTTKIDTFDDDEFDFDENKKSAVPILIAVFIVVLLGGAGVYFGISRFSTKTETPQTVATVTEQKAQPEMPQLPVDSADTELSSGETEKESELQTPKTVVKKVETKKTESRPAATRSRPATTRRSTPPSRPAPKPAPRPAPKSKPSIDKNEVVFTSQPSGASVVVNGKTIGTTPFTWDKPFFGQVSATANKDGYDSKNVSFEFTGGKQTQSITLNKKAAVTPVARVEKPTPPPPPPPPPPAPKKEPEVDLPPVPEPSAPAATASAGGNASIFIASIPPVADVYLDGKLIGKTNVNELKLPAGTHSLKFVKGSKELVKAITVKPGGNPSQMVRLP